MRELPGPSSRDTYLQRLRSRQLITIECFIRGRLSGCHAGAS
jgi:hypothetical protein